MDFKLLRTLIYAAIPLFTFGLNVQQTDGLLLLNSEGIEADNDNSSSCDTDRQCLETMFCFNEKCHECFDCSKIFRKSRMRCAKEPVDCGDCLAGFKNDAYAGSHYFWCREDVSLAEHQKTDVHENSNFNFQLLVVFIIICFCLLGFASYYYYNSRQRPIPRNNSWTTNVRAHYQFTTPPPPYKEDDLPVNDNGSIPCSFQLQVIGNSEEDQQKAVPFLYVENLRTENGENNTIQFVGAPQNISSVSTETAFTAVNIDIHDENTVPSAWTPGASYGETVGDNCKPDDESPPKKRKRSNDGEEQESVPNKNRS